MPFIALEGLRFRYDDMDMVFDLAVETGEIVTVTGPSGAGKSTLLNLIAGFEQPSGGRLLIGETDMGAIAPFDRPVMTLFQDHNLFPHLDVFSNVALGIHPGLKLSAKDGDAVRQALAAVGLSDMEARLPGQLSGGERQRVAIARITVLNRPVLLLDEPFASLGPGLRAEMLALVAGLARERAMTVLLVSHNPSETLGVADRGAFIHEGRVRRVAPMGDLLNDPDLPGLTGYLGEGTMER